MAQVDLNNSQCIQDINNLGSTTYQNVCNNTSHVVAWGSGDWIGFLLAAIVILAITYMVVKIAKDIISD